MSGAQPKATPFKALETVDIEREPLGTASVLDLSPTKEKRSLKDIFKSGNAEVGNPDAQSTKAQSTKAQNDKAQNTKAQNTKAQNTKAQNTKAQSTDNAASEAAEIQQALQNLRTGDFHARWDSAKQFIKRFQSDRAVPYLINELQSSSDPEHQWFLIRILGQYDQPIVVEKLAHLLVSTTEAELQTEAIRALTQLGNSAIAILSQQLQSNQLSQRRLAALTLAQIRRSDVIAPLLSIARDPDAQLRLIAVEALGSFHDPRVTPVLISAFTDDDAITIEAVRTLGRRADLLSEYDLIKLLQTCLQHRAEPVAKESAIALGRLSTEEAAQALGTFLMQPAPTTIKVTAVQALSWLDSAVATAHLITAFDGSPPVVMPALKQEIAKALGRSRTFANKSAAAKPLVEWLQRCVSSEASADSEYANLTLKQTVISSVAWLGAVEAIESLIPLLADAEPRIQMHALSALKQIEPRDAKASVASYLQQPGLGEAVKAAVSEHLSAWA